MITLLSHKRLTFLLDMTKYYEKGILIVCFEFQFFISINMFEFQNNNLKREISRNKNGFPQPTSQHLWVASYPNL